MDLSITKYCSIHDKTFSINGEVVFKNNDVALDIDFLSALYREMKISYPKFFKMDALAKTGFIASELLLKDTDLDGDCIKQETGLFFSNKSSSLDTDEKYQQTIGSEYFPSPSVFVYTLPNIVMGEIAIRHKIYGENTFFVSDGFDSENIFNYVSQSFKEGKIKNALVGWVDFYNGIAEATIMIVENKPGGIVFNTQTIKTLIN
jgi:3-oxoacyl-(acyl-carrier-protein) synthase